MFSILMHKEALKEIDRFPTEDKRRILNAIRQIAPEVTLQRQRQTHQGCEGASEKKSGRVQDSLHCQLREERGCHT
jgi:predicted RNA binding protein with dsRBD fold (UPF0201 family)